MGFPSVRSTNVYEERSLGVYDEGEEYDPINDDAHWNRPSESRVAIWGKYLARHARRQLSFGITNFLTASSGINLASFDRYVVALCVAVPSVHYRGALDGVDEEGMVG